MNKLKYLIILILFYLNIINGFNVLNITTSSSTFGNEKQYQFLMTPFFPGTNSIFYFGFIFGSTFDTPTSFLANASIYNGDGIKLFDVNQVNIYIKDNNPTISPTTSGGAAILFNDKNNNDYFKDINNNINSNHHRSLKVATIAEYTLTLVINDQTKLLNSTDNTFYKSYYLGLVYNLGTPKNTVQVFPSDTFSFNAPAYDKLVEDSVINTDKTLPFEEYGVNYCQQVSVVKVNSTKSSSYGLYYSKTFFNSEYRKLQFIKSDNSVGGDGLDYYYYFNKFTNSSINQPLVDGITNQFRPVISNFNCDNAPPQVTNISVSIVSAIDWSSSFIVMVSEKKINEATINYSPVKFTTSFQLPTGLWYTLYSIPSPNSYFIELTRQQFTKSISFGTMVPQIGFSCTYKIISNTFSSNDESSFTFQHKNRQIQFLIECTTTNPLKAIAINCGGVYFFGDNQINSNSSFYSKLVSIPDSLVMGNTNIDISVYPLYETGRGDPSSFSIQIILFTGSGISKVQPKLSYSVNINVYSATYFTNSVTYTFQPNTPFKTPNSKLSMLPSGNLTPFSQSFDSFNVSTSFPYGFSGFNGLLTWVPSIPIPSDTPTMTFSILGNSESGNLIYKSSPTLKRDLVNPGVTAKFNWGNGGSQFDEIVVSVWDSIGIGASDKCSFSYANNVFSLTPGDNVYSIKKNIGSTSYIFSFNQLKINRYFCNYIQSPPIVIDCSDIRGNRIYENKFETNQLKELFFDGLDKCISSTTNPPPPVSLMGVFISFISSTEVVVSALLGGVLSSAEYNVIASIYNDHDNVGPIETSKNLTQNSIDFTTRTTSYSDTFFFPSATTKTTKKYISIKVSTAANLLSTFTLSTRELEYLDQSSSSQEYGNKNQIFTSQFSIISNNQLSPMLLLKDLELLDGPTVFTLKTSYPNGIKNLTLTFNDQQTIGYKPQSVVYVNDGLSSSAHTIQSPLTTYSQLTVYIELVCDYFENCYQFSPFANLTSKYFTNATFTTPVSTRQPITIGKPTFSKQYVDVTSENRRVKVFLNLTKGSDTFSPSFGYDPLFYISEKESGDQLSCPLKLIITGSPMYSCELDIPLFWGYRGIGQCSVWNLVEGDGYLSGGIIPNCALFIYSQYTMQPIIWSISAKMNGNILFFSGTNLDLVPSTILDNPSGGISFSNLNFTMINNTYYSYTIPVSVNGPLNVSFNWGFGTVKDVSVFVITCMKTDCSGHGTCNTATLQCACSQGWGGSDCSIDQTYKCINNCNGHGTCTIDIVCNCEKGYTGVSCETYSPDIGLSMSMNTSKNEPSINLGSFGTNTNNKSMELNQYTKSSGYSILIPYIQEIDFFGKLVKNYTFTPDSWSIRLANDTVTAYNTTLTEYSDVVITLETINIATTREWAGQLLNLPDHSIKYSVLIRNYTFTSNLNTLQLIYQASPTSKISLECEIKQSIAWGAKRSTDMHWVTIPNNQVSLYGRFSNNLIADDRIVSTSNEGLEFGTTIQVKVNIPFFSDYVELDPDFSVLVNSDLSPDQYDECGIKIEGSSSNSSSRKWVIPVAVVVSVAGAAIIITAFISILYTKNTNIRTKILSLKSKLSRSSSSKNISMKGL